MFHVKSVVISRTWFADTLITSGYGFNVISYFRQFIRGI